MSQNSEAFINPENIIAQSEIKPNSKVADFGCGHGYLTLPLAKAVGQGGKVMALDVMPSALEAVGSLVKLNNLFNVETRLANLENDRGSGLDDASMDLVALSNILFQSKDKEKIIKEAKRILKPDGSLLVVEWIPEKILSPKEGWPITDEEMKKIIEKSGFEFKLSFDSGKHHYGFIFKK